MQLVASVVRLVIQVLKVHRVQQESLVTPEKMVKQDQPEKLAETESKVWKLDLIIAYHFIADISKHLFIIASIYFNICQCA